MAREIGWQETKIRFFAIESTQNDQNRDSEDWERVGRGSGPYDVTNRAECFVSLVFVKCLSDETYIFLANIDIQ